jgi:LPXTG-site transpeptidase (sortase) family protein
MRVTLRQANNGLLGLIILINLYILIAPFVPRINYWWQSHHGHVQQTLTREVQDQKKSSSSIAVNQVNTLVVPSMLLNTPVFEGQVKDTYSILDKGIWRWPLGSSPDKGSNTVLIGHRFTYTQPKGIFYYMDKVQMGDEIGLIWDNKSYTYKVTSIGEVDPSSTSITNPTKDARITMYTCTPLWNPKHRLVVVAELENV